MNRAVIICNDAEGTPAILGAEHAECVGCGKRVWVSPSSRDMVAKGARPHCWGCARLIVAADPNPQIGITREQIDELRVQFGKEARA
jgi:hypothetical protein